MGFVKQGRKDSTIKQENQVDEYVAHSWRSHRKVSSHTTSWEKGILKRRTKVWKGKDKGRECSALTAEVCDSSLPEATAPQIAEQSAGEQLGSVLKFKSAV